MRLEEIIIDSFNKLIDENGKEEANILWRRLGDELGLKLNSTGGKSQVIQFGLNRPKEKIISKVIEEEEPTLEIPRFGD